MAAKTSPQEIAKRMILDTRLKVIGEAIREKRAYLTTAWGRMVVTSYNHDTGWAVCNNTNQHMHQRSFLICLDAILIQNKPIYEDRRVVKHSSFTFNGRVCESVSHEIERVWNWE